MSKTKFIILYIVFVARYTCIESLHVNVFSCGARLYVYRKYNSNYNCLPLVEKYQKFLG